MATQLLSEQRTQEWLQARRGKVTASLAAACLGLDPHKGPLAAFHEITTGRGRQQVNKHMAWGVRFEDQARAAYECLSGWLVAPGGFWVSDEAPWLAASPDGLCGAEGLVEIKCPSRPPAAIPAHHAIQMRVQMAVLQRAWCDYYAWNQNEAFCARLPRDPDQELALLAALEAFYQRHVLPDVAPPRRRPK